MGCHFIRNFARIPGWSSPMAGDGQPGGAGLDADISNLTSSSQDYLPTFFQFLFALNPRPILVIAFVTAIVGFCSLISSFRLPGSIFAACCGWRSAC